MGSHSKPDSATGVTHATYDARGHIGDAQRVVITKPVRNYPAFFALAGALVSFVIFSWYLVPLIIASALLGYGLSKTSVREGKTCALTSLVLLGLSLIHHV